MKKLTAIFVCLLLVASLAVSAFAAGTAQMTLTADKNELKRGETVVITFSISEVAGLKSAGFAMKNSYDANVFEFVEGAWVHSAATSLAKVGVTGGILSGSAALASASDVSGAIFQLTMKVKDNAPVGETSLTASGSARDTAALTVAVNTLKLKIVCATHTEKTEVTAATCAAEGKKVTTCTVCNATIKTETIAKLAHTEKVEVTKAATCKEAGVKTTSCTACQEVIKTEAIAKLAHTYETKVTKEATCTAEGEKTTTCTACGDSSTEAIAALGHAWDKGTVTTPATTEKEGVKTYKCATCAEEKTEVIAKVESPATGDNTMLIPFVLLMVLSAAGFAVTVIGKKRAA